MSKEDEIRDLISQALLIFQDSGLQSNTACARTIIGRLEEHGYKIENQSQDNWVSYNWEDEETHPKNCGRYEIYRPSCDKQHYCQWNGSGWSSENNTIKSWREIKPPNKTNN